MGKFIIGLIFGVAIAGGLAFYLSYAPNQIVNKVTNSGASTGMVNSSAPIVLAPGTKLQASIGAVPNNVPQSVSSADTQSYDFYNILPGTKANTSSATANNSASGGGSSAFVVQAGTFTDQDAANDMKARLALLGIDSQIKSQQQENKVINRVVIGTFATSDEANVVLERLKNENIQGVIIKVNK